VPESCKQSPVVVHVCTTCHAEGESRESGAGAKLHAALLDARSEADPQVAAVECFSVCRRPCTLSFSARGCWTYVYGDFAWDTDPNEILAAARLYGDSPQGLIPWKQRPQALKKGVVARFPPINIETEPGA
jgi:predicted metal-binding protein